MNTFMDADLNEVTPSFLPDRLVALDCEFSGVVPERDDVIQIALIKLKRDGLSYTAIGSPLIIYPFSSKKPSNEFHEKYLVDQFRKANQSELSAFDVKVIIHDWLGDWKGQVQPFGDCVNADMAFLYAKGMIDRGDIVGGEQVPGTFHYEQFDLHPIKCLARTKFGKKEELASLPEHDAYNDCMNQLAELNWCLSMMFDFSFNAIPD